MSGVGSACGRGSEIVEQKESVLAQSRIGAFAEEGDVASVVVVVPEMEREPRGAHGPDASAERVDGRGVAPDIGVVVNNKAAGFVVVLCGASAGRARVCR